MSIDNYYLLSNLDQLRPNVRIQGNRESGVGVGAQCLRPRESGVGSRESGVGSRE
ncbi:hypothetical protein [Spirulina subsalsa]|uniref:hypothetical protein n=1 Tax=Spirulina subsalsa TaxID=54311 RepID=UPI0013DFBBD1|nr:hypothetical protein [Spirulina subsalsa]